MARKVPKRDYRQAKSAPARTQASTWTPFAAPKGRQDIADDVKYEAYDRVKRGWFTHKPKRG
jgi:hypothetical protein